jgi:EpsI family protein
MSRTVDKKGLIIAATVATALFVASGIAYRALAAYLDRPAEGARLARGTLEGRFPLEIGAWTGKPVPIEDAIVEAADCDDYISRGYSRGSQAVSLWVAYGVRARDLMPHRPEVCYPGNGFTLVDSNSLEVPLADGTPLACRVYQFARGDLGGPRIAVLNYYIVDGRYSPDVSLLRSEAWRGQGAIRYMAQVQITAPVTTGGASGLGAVREFAAVAGPAIRAIMPDAWAEADSDAEAGADVHAGAAKASD